MELSQERARERVLADEEVLTLARLGARVESHYGSPQDIEWAEQGGRLYRCSRGPSPPWARGRPSRSGRRPGSPRS
ncbi:PEP/pyruvate-binding domain-containing protein [Cystobacter fuscus]